MKTTAVSVALLLTSVASVGAGRLEAQAAPRVRQAPVAQPARTTIRVPDDVASLQRAIRLSSDDGVILVSGDHDPVVVDRPLTILGGEDFRIGMGFLGYYPCSGAGIQLRGPGHGVVTVAGLETSGGGDCLWVAPAIEGGGFDELRVMDAELRVARSGLTGSGYGASAIAIDDIPLVVVSGTYARGGQDDIDECYGHVPGDGHPALDAPDSTVVVLDSTLEGGHGGYLCCSSPYCFRDECPSSLTGLGGAGGDAVVAAEAFVAGSTLTGGTGSTFTLYLWPDVFDCGKQPDGASLVAGIGYALDDDLQGASRMHRGLPYTLAWNVDGPVIGLWAADGFATPTPFLGEDWSLLPPASSLFLGVYPAFDSWTFRVPTGFAWVGHQLSFQGADAAGTLTRPVTATVSD